MTELVQRLGWDSDFFGFPIARLRDEEPEIEAIDRADHFCESNGICCLYALVSAAKPFTIQRLCSAGYRWVDIRLTLRADISKRCEPLEVRARLATPDDIPALRGIAAVSHRDGRFYADPCFPRERCDAFYAQWIENSVLGFEDAVLIVDDADGPVGYVTCKLRDAGRGQIGLFAVAERARGQGIGRALLESAEAWFSGRDCTCVDVVTQGANVAAQRIYQRNGFITQDVQIWLHKWFIKS